MGSNLKLLIFIAFFVFCSSNSHASTNNNITLVLYSDIGGTVLINGEKKGTIENNLFLKNDPLVVDNLQTGECKIEIQKDSEKFQFQTTIKENFIVVFDNNQFTSSLWTEPSGQWTLSSDPSTVFWWGGESYTQNSGRLSTQENVTITGITDKKWKWTSSGWGSSPRMQIAEVEKSENGYKFRDLRSHCLEGNGSAGGEKCESIEISPDGGSMKIQVKDNKFYIAKRIW